MSGPCFHIDGHSAGAKLRYFGADPRSPGHKGQLDALPFRIPLPSGRIRVAIQLAGRDVIRL